MLPTISSLNLSVEFGNTLNIASKTRSSLMSKYDLVPIRIVILNHNQKMKIALDLAFHIYSKLNGRSSLVVMVTNSLLAYHEFETSAAEDPQCRGIDAR
ncbi:hypothetical protein TNCV_2363741 [Trichonephila clavipes]|nr:hypothetical protein TNCV_2363741 [Trichonephila clavipes]